MNNHQHGFPYRIRRSVFGLTLCILMAACGNRTPEYNANGPSPAAAVQPTAIVNLDEVQRTAADFLNAWMQDNYGAMYGMLTATSRDAFPLADFEKLYTDAEHTMTVMAQGKSYSVAGAIQRDNGAEVGYDMTFKTLSFGTFTDTNRVLHVVNTSEGWRVVWSTGDIIAEMNTGAALVIQQTTPTRGNIYDRAGDVLADENGSLIVATLYTKTYPTGNPDDCFNALAKAIRGRTAEQLKTSYNSFTNKDFAFEAGTISPDTLEKERPNLEHACTLTYSNRPTRRYVAGGLAPHVVGYIGPIPAEQADEWKAKGYDPDALIGLNGIEQAYESTLAGRGTASLIIRNGTAYRVLAKRAAVPPQSVYLTIDRPIQQAVQDALADAFKNSVWGSWSSGAAAIVMDVHTGEILATASYPDFNVDAFNPNTTLKNPQELINGWLKDPRRPTLNRAMQGQFAPGSVFKIVSMAAAAGSGQFNLNTRIACGGVWNGGPLGDRVRYDWLKGGHGSITLKQALTGSCDIYFWNVGWKLNGIDPNILVSYAKQMGFGGPTGIKDAVEAIGTLPDPANYEKINGIKWRGSDALNTVIGQGDVTVTPLQIVRMVAAIANGGTLYQPLLVKQIGIIGSAPSYKMTPVANGNLNLKPEIIQGIHDAMCDVTETPMGTARFVYKDLTGVAVCGKTGTAQTAGYPHAWFAAFAGKTSDKPDIAVVVVVEHSNEGSYIAAPIVRRIIESYYNLPITPWPSWYGGGLPELGGE